MKRLFSETGMRRLDEIVRPGLLCVFDFDGTLSPIVPQPEQAGLPPDILQKLVALNAVAPVAIITGRSLADIRTRLGFEPDFVIGNHGIEGLPGWERRASQYEQMCRSWEEILSQALHSEHLDSGIRIENKRYSLSVHYRLARDWPRTELQLMELFARLMPSARVIAGKCVFSLLPQDAADKGRALEQLMQIGGARSALYVGDDVTDEDVFRLRRRDLLTVRIEQASASAAEFYLPDARDIAPFLDELIQRLRQQQLETNKQADSASPARNR